MVQWVCQELRSINSKTFILPKVQNTVISQGKKINSQLRRVHWLPLNEKRLTPKHIIMEFQGLKNNIQKAYRDWLGDKEGHIQMKNQLVFELQQQQWTKSNDF